jgi:isopentenyl diphosphate isomerase/L-lactate dehydrogenase-like FMN-dependent dehydrogenase
VVGQREPIEAPVTPDEEIVLEQAPAGSLEGILSVEAFEPRAHRVLSEPALAYIAGGAADEITLQNNSAAFRRRRLRPRVLANVERVDASTTLLGAPVSMPLGLAPTGFNRLAHKDGEVAAARAAADAGVLYCISTFSSCRLEDAAEAGGPRWFQLYVLKDRGRSEEMMQRARDAGYSAVVFTADLPVVGYRERELRVGDALDLSEVGNLGPTATSASGLADIVDFEAEQSLTWSDVAWAAEASRLPVVVKGILTAEDAALAADNGAAGIVVSNHGGRQLDRSPATIDVLEECAGSVGDDVEVYLDGGVRRGTDVLTALALGAHAVFIGRPYLYAMAVGGRDGVARALAILKAEIENAMALLGVQTVSEISRGHTF